MLLKSGHYLEYIFLTTQFHCHFRRPTELHEGKSNSLYCNCGVLKGTPDETEQESRATVRQLKGLPLRISRWTFVLIFNYSQYCTLHTTASLYNG